MVGAIVPARIGAMDAKEAGQAKVCGFEEKCPNQKSPVRHQGQGIREELQNSKEEMPSLEQLENMPRKLEADDFSGSDDKEQGSKKAANA